MAGEEFDQGAMTHTLPRAQLVDRIDYLCSRAQGQRVVHVGFVDSGCQTMQQGAGTWLHGHLDRVATSLVGIDIDELGVKEATEAGFEAYAVDCRDREALEAIGVEPAPVVIAGEVIEHLSDPGSFLDGLQNLVRLPVKARVQEGEPGPHRRAGGQGGLGHARPGGGAQGLEGALGVAGGVAGDVGKGRRGGRCPPPPFGAQPR